jgi:hypothetical protein
MGNIAQESPEVIAEFEGEYRWLSNFYYIGDTTVEHRFQAAKTDDADWKLRIMVAKTPGRAKRLGNQCPLRHDWNAVKVDTMLSLLRWKFSHPALRDALLATGDALIVEGNNHGDNFWGMCPPGSGDGLNVLGKLIMRVRRELKEVSGG